MTRPVLSIIIPAYNEANALPEVLDNLFAVPLTGDVQKQVILVNDGSTDETEALVLGWQKTHPLQELIYLQHTNNQGKGAAIHTGIKAATGDYIIIQDADLEYDPRDINGLLQPVLENKADVVFGSRFISGKPHRILFFWHSIGNKFLTFLSNMFSNLNLTDMENGYKLFRADILKLLVLKEKRFGFEPEVTARVARIPGIRIYEVANAYYGRTYAEGKKIKWKDGFKAIYCVFRYNLFEHPAENPRKRSLFANPAFLITGLFFISGLILLLTAKGTADEGDSIMHYLYARHAYQYPEFFFNQWAKPLYVLITSPFAQFGFNGIKLFNLVTATLTIWLTYKTARKLGIPNAWMAAFLAAFASMTMIITLSGLTEPLFALWLIAGIYWLILDKKILALTFLSFLPFIRSEGLIILCVVAVYMLVKKYYRYLPLLITSHLLYAIAGYGFHNDFFWVFNKLSYATFSSAYGSGPWMHFVNRLPEVTGLPVYCLLIVGLGYGLFTLAGKYLFRDKDSISTEELYLVYGSFVVYFIAHSAFWALGIFNSFGLLRVLIGVLPFIALISLRGMNTLTDLFRLKWLRYFLLAIVMIFPFIQHKYSIIWKRDLTLKADQQAEQRLADYVKRDFPDYKNYVFYYEPCYLSVTLDINYFDTARHKRLLGAFEENKFSTGQFFIWDDWFAPVEGHVPLEQIENNPGFLYLKSFEEKDYWGKTRTVKLFRKK